ncbi:PREDICTED: autophagy-related protein 13b [Nelumbo nucifera]|uniref:Autophagy-related protein 13b n=2 Tax=Nelumbo nucifera TaxID=4432 RepID=A0A1U7YV43_NELNU|nr:PREDICTED: autophagy-related protein 13b [Nelumbo nucifera]XP_010241728.1 PREDICTED: autophagy-related protein 13b [Nelumbo nucifera]DAD22562.1 TPA_asm: hypothetical protein HUJ06_024025 [Nelumbo nucifera]
MASSQSNIHSESAKIEQIITEFFTKSLHIILESRSPCVSSRNYSGEQILSSPSSSSSSSSSVKPRDKWFNLALRVCPSALENIDLWRQSNQEPMVVDVILIQRPTDLDPVRCSPRRGLARNYSLKERFRNCWNPGQEEYPSEVKREKIIERWIVQYESRKSRDSSSGGKRTGSTSSHSLYKKSIILLRSLYVTVRLLPAYKLFRDLNSSGQIHTFNLDHRVCSFVEPFTRREEAEMQQFGFMPIDTNGGRLSLSVLYHPKLSDVNLESSTPISTQLIPDYVGSPMTDPLKRFPSLPVTTHVSPSSAPFCRRHSWSYDLYGASAPSASPSPSPTYSDSRGFPSNMTSNRLPPTSSPHHPPETPLSSNTSLAHNKNTSFDEYWPSPTFSPSPSPSPPTHVPGDHLSKALLRSESAPVSISAAKLGGSPGLPTTHMLPPSPSLKGTRPGLQIDNVRAPARPADVQTCITAQKILYAGRDEVGNLSGAKISSNSSPRISFSRSSSRLSFQDEFDGSDFACPFAVDDDDLMDLHTRPESFDGKRLLSEPLEPGGLFPIRKSQDAAVGSLVRMLKTAPPLHHDSNSFKLSRASEPENRSKSTKEAEETSDLEVKEVQNTASCSSFTSSRLLMSKTTADALEELQGYREIKELLLRQSSRSQTVANDAHVAQSVSGDTK